MPEDMWGAAFPVPDEEDETDPEEAQVPDSGVREPHHPAASSGFNGPPWSSAEQLAQAAKDRAEDELGEEEDSEFEPPCGPCPASDMATEWVERELAEEEARFLEDELEAAAAHEWAQLQLQE